jgi:hypothetical protein
MSSVQDLAYPLRIEDEAGDPAPTTTAAGAIDRATK